MNLIRTRAAVAEPLAELRWYTRRHAFVRTWHTDILTFVLGLVTSLEFFESAMFVFGANYIMGGIAAAPEEFVRVQAAYAVGSMITIVLHQRIVQRFGYRRYLLATIALFMLGLWGCAKSTNIDQMILARLVQGMGGGAFFTSGRVLAVQMFSQHQRSRAGLGFLLYTLAAPAIGPAFAAWIIETWDWSMVFYSVIPATAVAWLGVWLLIPSGVGRKPGMKLTGTLPWHRTVGPFLVFILAVGCLQLAVSEARLDVLAHPARLALMIAAGVLLLGVFLWSQWRHPEPLLSLRLFHNPTFWVGMLLYVVYYGISSFTAYLFPFFAQQGLGIPLRTTGWLNSFSTVVMVVVGFCFARFLGPRLKHVRPVMALGVACVLLSSLWFATRSAITALDNLIPGLVLKGIFGALLILPVGYLTFRDMMSDHRFSHGYQGKNLMRQIAMSAASALAAVALQNRYYALQERLTGQLDPIRADVGQWTERAGAWFSAQGYAPGQAHSAALATLQQIVNTQAMLLACQDMYYWVAVAALVSLVVVIVQKKLP